VPAAIMLLGALFVLLPVITHASFLGGQSCACAPACPPQPPPCAPPPIVEQACPQPQPCVVSPPVIQLPFAPYPPQQVQPQLPPPPPPPPPPAPIIEEGAEYVEVPAEVVEEPAGNILPPPPPPQPIPQVYQPPPQVYQPPPQLPPAPVIQQPAPSGGEYVVSGGNDAGATPAPAQQEQQQQQQQQQQQETINLGHLAQQKSRIRFRQRAHGTETVDPKCNNEKLRELITTHINGTATESKRSVHKKVTDEFGPNIDVICSSSQFSFIINAELYCEAQKNGVTCFAFR
jgi:hypothetical protein